MSNSLSLTVKNTGTVTLDSFFVNVNLGGELPINEWVNSRISPNESITEQLDFTFLNNRLDYLCASIGADLGFEETNINDNEDCLFFTSEQAVIGLPNPNPSSGIVRFNIVTQSSGSVNIRVFNSSGGEVSDFDLFNDSGSTSVGLDLSSQQAGLYLVVVEVNGISEVYRIMIRD